MKFFKMLWDRFLSGPMADYQLYRRVVKRTPTEHGEIITLDCGHEYELIIHRRETLPCNECNPKPLW